MKQLIDFIPLIIFFILFKTSGIFIATGALIAATAVQVALTWFIYKKVEKMQEFWGRVSRKKSNFERGA